MIHLVRNDTEHKNVVVRSILKWVATELELHDQPVVVDLGYSTNGYYHGNFNLSHRVELRIPKPGVEWSNHDRKLRGGPPGGVKPGTWEEALVAIAAHEMQHMRQSLGKSNKKARYSEVECEWTEYRLWRRWRDEEYPRRLRGRKSD